MHLARENHCHPVAMFAMLENWEWNSHRFIPRYPFIQVRITSVPLKARGIRSGTNCMLSITGPSVSKPTALHTYRMNEIRLRLVALQPCSWSILLVNLISKRSYWQQSFRTTRLFFALAFTSINYRITELWPPTRYFWSLGPRSLPFPPLSDFAAMPSQHDHGDWIRGSTWHSLRPRALLVYTAAHLRRKTTFFNPLFIGTLSSLKSLSA